MVFYLAMENTEFGHIGLFVRLVQVCPQRFSERFFPLLQPLKQALQHSLSKLNIEGFSASKIGALSLYNLIDILCCVVFNSHYLSLFQNALSRLGECVQVVVYIFTEVVPGVERSGLALDWQVGVALVDERTN